jgi:hypothetical protein
MNTPYTKTKGEIIGLVWIVLIIVITFVLLAGWPLSMLGDNCVPVKQAGTECWLYASKVDHSLDHLFALVTFLCVGNYLSPNLGGRKVACDTVIGVLLFDSVLSIVRFLLNVEVTAYATFNIFFVIVPFILATRIIRERSQTLSSWFFGVFNTTSDA